MTTRADILADLELERLAPPTPAPTTAEVRQRHADGLDAYGYERPALPDDEEFSLLTQGFRVVLMREWRRPEQVRQHLPGLTPATTRPNRGAKASA